MSPPSLADASSWKQRWIRDAMANELGFVIDVVETDDGIRLIARFPGESENRLIALEPTADGEFITPGEVKARYRPPTSADLDRLKQLAAARKAA